MNPIREVIVAMYAGFGLFLLLGVYIFKRAVERKERALQIELPFHSDGKNLPSTDNNQKNLVSAGH
jgi:hypothetical protein